MSYKVIIDSCGELLDRWKEDERFVSAPLTLEVDGEQIVDDERFDQASFLEKVKRSPHAPKSACPSPEVYRKYFEGEEERAYAVTLSAELSGSYNSAVLGMQMAKEAKPQKPMYVFNSCSASVGETLVGLKIEECERAGMTFDETVECVESYIEEQNTYFVLENLETLRKNGRLSNIKALVATALKIKPIMGSTPEGKICQLDQARGMNKALVKMADHMIERAGDTQDKILAISHCNSPQKAKMLRDAILEKISVKDCIILDTAGVSSMYANDGGIIMVI